MSKKVVTLPFEQGIVDMEEKIDGMREIATKQKGSGNQELSRSIENDIQKMEEHVLELKKEIYSKLSRWEKVQVARHPNRPFTLDYISLMMEDFVELAGDRLFADDKAIIGGFAKLTDGKKFSKTVMIIGHQKGRDTKQNIYRNFGMAEPEGYRKAIRLMKLAEKFRKPIITFIDTPGASPGLGAEERGQAEAIARSMFEMAGITVPIICVIIGEGASGGAIGIGVGDRILMLENSWYSVISPESCSSILWRNWNHKEEAAEALKLTAPDLLKYKIIDKIISEPLGGAHANHDEMAKTLKDILINELTKLSKINSTKLVASRIDKFSSMGVFLEK